MRTALRAAAIAAALLMTGQPAHAQGFLKRLAERAVTRAEQGAERIVEDAGRRDEAASTPAGSPRTARGSEPVQPGVLTPRAVRGSAPRSATPAAASAPAPAKVARYAADLSAPPEAEAAKAAYNAFGEVRCSDCEGGIDFDGLPKFSSDQFSGQWAERAKRVGNWPLSHVHRWQGKASVGTLTIVAEEMIGDLRCRRLQYRLVRGKASAERPGLVCWGLGHRSSSEENWHEIY